jgi:threonine aldolase
MTLDHPIDLRSDTVTKPDAEMRRAMAEAEVGDDVLGEDPTAQALQEEAAAAIGTEAALFVPSGTMGNQIALRVHGRPGSEVLCDERAHVVLYEVGAMAALSGLMPHPLRSADGLPAPETYEAAIGDSGGFRVPIGVVEVENTHNVAGGRVFDRARLDAVLAVARRHRKPVHLDGARIFNAATALGVPASALAAGFDSVMFCLSKGLGAPVGSLLCGTREFVQQARQTRRMFGGGMRQVGVLAAAGRVALRRGPERLAEDHEHARWLAERLAAIPGIELDPRTVETNIVIFGLRPTAGPESASQAFIARLAASGVLGVPVDRTHVRLVTHRDVSRAEVEEAARRLAAVAA